MSEPENSSSVAVHHYDEGGETGDGPQSKRLKLDLVTQQSECGIPASKPKIDDLPDELIVMVLSYYSFTDLIEIGQNVCTQWRRASHDPLLWHDKDYCIDEGDTDAEVLAILRRVPRLRSLEIKRHVKATVIQAVCKNCKQLNYLNLEPQKRIGLSLLKKLVASCRNIKSLQISSELLYDENSAIVLSRLTLLNSLTVVGITNKTIHLAPFAKGCPELSRLKLAKVNHICTEDLSQIIEAKSKTLFHLELPWTGNDKRCLVPLLTSCTALVKLRVYGVPKSSDELMEAFSALSHLPNLRSLSLWFWRCGVPAYAFKSTELLHLEVLRIGGFYSQNNVLVALSESCPNIKVLHLDAYRPYNDGDFKELHRFKKLQTLALTSGCEIRDAGFLHLSQVPSMRKLLIQNCDLRDMKDEVHSILHLHSLEILSFTNVQYICYFPFNRIPETLTNLRILNVVESELHKKVLEQLKNQMPGLQVYATNNVDKNYLRKMEKIMKL